MENVLHKYVSTSSKRKRHFQPSSCNRFHFSKRKMKTVLVFQKLTVLFKIFFSL
ncbi:hypothetical protein LEP1GSC150_2656 [Leptospira interrogans serovar Copenhageni str. LT2050]|uniref:Uncharacterized protein n=1 Tax=Leptospira interrogans serovar Copenhageni str. LT2050 TaxID=1001598 RepID=M3I1Z1_LEPIT|nr:hypothetical protein LEP1GSC150_2656 [Leptospira interrogans serovar Copenhageni str. LT2050]